MSWWRKSLISALWTHYIQRSCSHSKWPSNNRWCSSSSNNCGARRWKRKVAAKARPLRRGRHHQTSQWTRPRVHWAQFRVPNRWVPRRWLRLMTIITVPVITTSARTSQTLHFWLLLWPEESAHTDIGQTVARLRREMMSWLQHHIWFTTVWRSHQSADHTIRTPDSENWIPQVIPASNLAPRRSTNLHRCVRVPDHQWRTTTSLRTCLCSRGCCKLHLFTTLTRWWTKLTSHTRNSGHYAIRIRPRPNQ